MKEPKKFVIWNSESIVIQMLIKKANNFANAKKIFFLFPWTINMNFESFCLCLFCSVCVYYVSVTEFFSKPSSICLDDAGNMLRHLVQKTSTKNALINAIHLFFVLHSTI